MSAKEKLDDALAAIRAEIEDLRLPGRKPSPTKKQMKHRAKSSRIKAA